ncbi:TorD/DmsD family molecular chaperone [Thioalkalivibrio paradoxus]|uniref:Molecular chaperone n=1 Tax=Thioalkalivibrio paradoxus ARh 1 TaxID=713585 RepID=W0DK51_9GAMM|nr:molecular chaperone TorD family protein [Thioalkalivibrio paradoxus]AHE97260.1 molecular chaperone [Thioalkalivibrio paradoxus ARh 1]
MQAPWLPEEDQARVGTYALLARLLAAPADQAQLDELAQLEVDRGADGAATTAFSLLKLAAQKARAEHVDDEYHRLFIGIGRGELVPYGSWYQTGALMERPLSELRQDLAEFGLEREPSNPDPEDHAAFLCEAMALLASSREVPETAQRGFFQRHVGNWMPAFFRDLENSDAACFYKAVGHLGTVFMELEKAYQRFDER